MRKNEYLRQLTDELQGLPESEINEILRDQQEYISEALKSGRHEDEVIRSLGTPKELAKELKAHHQIRSAVTEKKLMPKINKVLKATLAIGVLTPFNLIFVLGPFLGVCGVLLACWAVSAAMIALGLGGVGLAFLSFPAGAFLFLTLLFSSFAGLGMGLLFLVACYFLSQWFLRGLLQYLKWNFDLIIGE